MLVVADDSGTISLTEVISGIALSDQTLVVALYIAPKMDVSDCIAAKMTRPRSSPGSLSAKHKQQSGLCRTPTILVTLINNAIFVLEDHHYFGEWEEKTKQHIRHVSGCALTV